jgi:hypothetical protein
MAFSVEGDAAAINTSAFRGQYEREVREEQIDDRIEPIRPTQQRPIERSTG